MGKGECGLGKKAIETVQNVERAFWTIVFSARKRVGERGVLLPGRFDSVAKIRRFLQKNMTLCLAKRVIGNLSLRRIRGRLAVPVGDGLGPAPMVKVRILARSADRAVIAVRFGFDQSDRFWRVYQLRKTRQKGWVVYGRHPLDYPFDRPGEKRINGCRVQEWNKGHACQTGGMVCRTNIAQSGKVVPARPRQAANPWLAPAVHCCSRRKNKW